MIETAISVVSSKALLTLFGTCDQHLHTIRDALGVSISAYDGQIHIEGEEAAVALLRRAFALGLNWVDSANGYTVSEERIGKALTTTERENIFVFTKGPGKTPEQIEEQIELSLERLQTDYIDVYQFHGVRAGAWEDMLTNGTVDRVVAYRDRGVIRHIGASSHAAPALLAAMDHPAIETVQWPFNFIMHDEAQEILAKCRVKGIGFIAMKPFGGGVFPHAGTCIRFLMQFPDIVADPGFETVAELEEVVALAESYAGLTDPDRQEMARLRGELCKRFCRRCGYCSPCPSGVEIVTLMNVPSFLKRLHPDKVFAEDRARAMETVQDCIDCGQCEEKCPYELPIRETIRREAQNYRQRRNEWLPAEKGA